MGFRVKPLVTYMYFNISKGRAGESSSQDAVAEKMKTELEKTGQEEKRDLEI